MPKKQKAGRALEILTARIEGALSGSGVVVTSPDHLADHVAGGTREVDVSLRSTVGSADVLVIVECRDRGRAADVTWIEQIASKRTAVRAAKAIAVSSGTFSKKAIATANAFGIDVRTLAQVNVAEVKRWTGSLQLFQRRAQLSNIGITITVGGVEPLPPEITERFDQLVLTNNFDAAFIALAGQEGLLSPTDLIKRSNPTPHVPVSKRFSITMPPNSALVISNEPVLGILVGHPPDDGSTVSRQHVMEFADGDAFFCLPGVHRTLRAVRLHFDVHLVSSTPIASDSYRYSSSKGVIEVAARTADLGDGAQLNFLEHREVADGIEPRLDTTEASPKIKQ
jgi:hypothetical protein